MDRVKILKDLLAEQPGDSFIQHALALEHIKMGDDLEAKRLFENVLTNDEKYIGSYYHLAKLLERADEKEAAIKWYQAGMLKAKEVGDQHAYNELQAAYDDLIDL
jgi:Tfp pilus assembly protein PilF